MSDPVFTSRMVRELKGAPLACLILLMICDGGVANEWLCRMSGYTDKPIAQALKLLSSPEYQLIRKTRGGWSISKGFQLALYDESRKNSVPTTTTSGNELINLINTEVVVVSRKNSDSESGEEEIPSDDERIYLQNLEMCKAVGIGEPTASRISELQHVTPEFIESHVRNLDVHEKIGIAILRIKNNETPPSTPVTEFKARNYSVSSYDEYLNR
jgi:hypothetical protein